MLIHSKTIFLIPGYRITEQIYSGSKTLVYRGVRELDQTAVIIKLMRNEYPTFTETAQFRNQYTITKNLDLPGIVKPLSLENYRNGYALVMEDFGGMSLKNYLSNVETRYSASQQKIISLQKFFHIAIQIASILEKLHRHRIIHKDIKPANILIHPETQEIKLTDFSIASLLPKEIQCLTNPNFLEGTLAYISPEQTGRMNRGIDYRSDFYSLGVTFFELLTGQLPFTTTDPMELVYSHIAKIPPNASTINPNIPAILSEIISKLMAKNAEDRYQSALGLKHDLEECKAQWIETGNITPFALGQQDISDRFLIPEKLYGRQQEVKILLTAFERVSCGTTEMILVTGYSGIGKTAVVNEVHKPISRQRGYFIKGKFDQFQRDIPLSGFVQAFEDLIRQLLSETDAELQQWKAKILSVLGEQAHVIVDVIPLLEVIIGKQPPVAELSGTAAANRFNLLFQRFINVFTNKENPLVIFLDDLQWSDTTSLKFIQLLLSRSSAVDNQASILERSEKTFKEVSKIEISTETEGSLLLIGAYRNNEVSKTHSLYLKIDEIKKTGASINTITLSALHQSDVNHLIADTLHSSEAVVIPLTQLVFAKTKGNPFFTHQFLKYLHNEGIIKFNLNLGHWQFEIDQVKELALTDDVVEFMALQIEKLPKHTQEVLKLAACIGNSFDLKSLAIVHEKSEVDTAADLWTALVEGLVLPENESYTVFQNDISSLSTSNSQPPTTIASSLPKYKFIHDRVQQAAYSLIPESQKQLIHLKIGQLLLNKLSVKEREEKIFELVNQFNIAVELITDLTERNELARMNLIAGSKALSSTAYAAAVRYLNTGIELLPSDSWETKYDLTLSLYEKAAEVAYLSGDFEQTQLFVQVVLQRANSLLDKVKVYEVKIQAYGAQNKALEAVNTALSVLVLLEVEFPQNLSQFDIQLEIEKTISNLDNQRINNLIHLPEMIEARPLAAMSILSSASAWIYQAMPELYLLFVFKQINLSIKYGNAPSSAFAYVNYGLILCSAVGDIESGYKFGELGISLLARFNTKEAKTKTLMVFYTSIWHWKQHAKETLKPLLEAYSTGLEMGDLEFIAYCLLNYCCGSYFTGRELIGLEREMANYSNAISKIKQETVFNWNEIHRQAVLNLLGTVENPCRLLGESYNEEKMLPLLLEAKDGFGLLHLYFSKLYLCYLFQDFSEAIENASLGERYLEGGLGHIVSPLFHFYDSLVRLAVYPNASESEQKSILDKVQANQEKMRRWAHHAPMNYLHKFYLVEAERLRLKHQYVEAMDSYERAITLAKQHEYINEEALANELAAKFYLEWGKPKIAQTYLTDAYYAYVRWGAKAKVDDLEKRYPQFLTPILQQEQLKLEPGKNYSSEQSTSLSTRTTNQVIVGSHTSISDSLDLAAVIKASVALSVEIELEQLLSTLMQVVMENAGASKCALVLSEGENLHLKVTATSSNLTSTSTHTEFSSIDLESSHDVPITLINYVKRTQEILVIDDIKDKSVFSTDTYIVRQQPKSLLCIPIINQGKLLGILYLENNLTTAAFTQNRVELLKLITTQAAISLENSMLYQNLAQANERLADYSHKLEEKVTERTQELHEKNQHLKQALQELQNTQTQLIQSEKMSSLGQMVAGIAHEINNPINFIHGNIAHAHEYVEDLLDLLTVYQQEYPNTSPFVRTKSEKIDFNFLVKDLPKLLDSMKVGTTRIRNIVLSLRNFSRLDEAEMKPVDVHEGIDNTLMILHHRLKVKGERHEIKVIREYGQLPLIECYPGQLNQVFMNIIANAVDALEEGMSKNQSSTPQIHIRTEFGDSQTIKIRIADNGRGMTEEVKQKIFDPFFTTKPVGSGTGLGLSISYQIIVEKHKGYLTCNSLLGQGTEFVIQIPMRQCGG